MCPPPRRIPLRREPARALPVPFWRYIFLVDAGDLRRGSCLANVPCRRLAWYITTASCSSCLLMRGARSVGSMSYVPTSLPVAIVDGELGHGLIRCYRNDSP